MSLLSVLLECMSFLQCPKNCSSCPLIHLYAFNKLTSVFYASVLLLIMNFVITLSK